jgi:photosystem II stability/assembly factor-like uncharacterized protein/subtilisin-like proprotein convertase family protein
MIVNRGSRLALFIALAATAAAMAQPAPDHPRGKGQRMAQRERALVPAPQSLPTVGNAWTSQGPGPMNDGQSEGITNSPVVGAVEAIVAHPSNADIVWIGAVNGGIWKTTNATAASPTWTSQTDSLGSLSIGCLTLDPTDATNNTLVAGVGKYSSFGGVGGPRSGLFRTTNGGTNWTALDSSMVGKNISAVVARGATIVAAVNFADSFSCTNVGIFRSTNSGATFTIVSGAVGTNMPQGRVFDMVGDPTNTAVLYASVRDAGATACNSGLNGIYKSTDTGATWSKVSNAAMDVFLADSANVSNTRMAVGASGEVYAGIVDNGQMAALFRSGTGGSSWTQLDTPSTNEGGTGFGLQPGEGPGEEEAGGQGSTHFSIVADPTNANIVYVGGDRQPGAGDGPATFPNSIGANNYTGRLFRVNAAAGSGSQVTPLTHCSTATAACNSTISTASNSAPHADSRRMVFDANGNILEGNDGGLFRRTNPRTTGDWFSLVGSLRVTEMHDVAYDTVSNMVVSGNQDNGTSEQTTSGSTTWSVILGGDGGDVAVDDITSGTTSTRYASTQYLGNFYRRGVNSSGSTTSFVFPALTVLGGGAALVGQFLTPFEINTITPTRMLFAASNDIYESLDRGDTITKLAWNLATPAIVYGGKSGGIDNAALIYAINSNKVYVRTSGNGAPVLTATNPGSSALRDIAVDPTDWQKAYVINSSGQVYSTTNAGGIWTEITGNLAGGTTDLRSIAFIPGSPNAIVVGGVNGVFRMAADAVGTWNQFGSGLTNAPVWDLDFDATDDTLIAGTMGRGAWKLTPASTIGPLPALTINDVAVTEGNAGTTTATFTVTLTPVSASTVTVNYATVDGTATQQSGTFSNSSSITINSFGSATPYPSNITVSGLSGTITKVTATLTGLQHTYPQDVDLLLVGPNGQSVILMSDAGGGIGISGVNLTFDDTAISQLSSATPASGTYQPSNVADGEGLDAWSSPAPGSGYASVLSTFNGTTPNGTWSLYGADDFAGDSGSIAGGWSVTISTTGGDYVGTTGTLTFTPSTATQPIAVTVNGDASVESNETFFVTLSNPSLATISDGTGQGTINNDDGLLPPTNVVATATLPTSVGVSWTAVAGAASYNVYRTADNSAYGLVGSTTGTSVTDNTAAANTAYLYVVRSVNGGESANSIPDLATTVIYTDPTLTAQSTTVKLVHFTQLLTAVNAVRTLANAGSAIAFSLPTPATNVTVRAQHILDLRTGLSTLWATLGLSAPAYTDPTLTTQVTVIKAVHVSDLRNAMQ